MEKALDQAKKALAKGEFPVGCVLVYEDNIIATGSRKATRGSCINEIDHAEITALRCLYRHHNNIVNSKITLFSTLEPCLMCFGAILLSGIGKIVYAYEDIMGGGVACDLTKLTSLYNSYTISIIPDILRAESLELFKAYFANSKNTYLKGSLLSAYTIEQ